MIAAASFDVNNPELWVNRGLAYGDGLFETMRFNLRTIPLLDFHLERLNKGLNKLQLNTFDKKIIEEVLAEVSLKTEQAIIKLFVFRANQIRSYTPFTHDIEWLLTVDVMSKMHESKTLSLMVSNQVISAQPMLAGLKHLSRLEQVIMASELNNYKGISDLLVIDGNNHVIETTHQNVVMIKQGQLYSPQLENSGVSGVALQWLKSHYKVNVEHIKVENLNDYDGIMVCNSIRGFRWVSSIEQVEKQCISFGTKQGIHDKISAQWEALFKS